MYTINDFPWNSDSVKEYHNHDNYKIIYTHSTKNRALLFFSSNAIYFPNDEETFFKTVVNNDQYEWQNLATHRLIQKEYKKIIFLRDIYKQWYYRGINDNLNDIDALIDWLNKETEGYSVTTCGSSSGGYMAALVGTVLNAEMIINSCGQFALSLSDNPGPYIEIAKLESYKYLDIDKLVRNSSNMFYLFPAQSEQDIEQVNTIKDSAINIIPISGASHGVTIRPDNYPYLLVMNNDEIKSLFSSGEELSAKQFDRLLPSRFSRSLVRFTYGIRKISSKIVRRLLSHQAKT